MLRDLVVLLLVADLLPQVDLELAGPAARAEAQILEAEGDGAQGLRRVRLQGLLTAGAQCGAEDPGGVLEVQGGAWGRSQGHGVWCQCRDRIRPLDRLGACRCRCLTSAGSRGWSLRAERASGTCPAWWGRLLHRGVPRGREQQDHGQREQAKTRET